MEYHIFDQKKVRISSQRKKKIYKNKRASTGNNRKHPQIWQRRQVHASENNRIVTKKLKASSILNYALKSIHKRQIANACLDTHEEKINNLDNIDPLKTWMTAKNVIKKYRILTWLGT